MSEYLFLSWLFYNRCRGGSKLLLLVGSADISYSDLFTLLNVLFSMHDFFLLPFFFNIDLYGPTMVKDHNETTMVSKLGKTKPVVVHENNNGAMKLVDTGLKSNNTLGVHIMEEKEGFVWMG